VVPRAADLSGRYVQRGQLLGYVIEPSLRAIRVAVRQDAVDLVRQDLRHVKVMLLADDMAVHGAQVVREVPAAARDLPSAALSTAGGGRILADPQDTTGETALNSYYQFELALDVPVPREAFGSRVYVRFAHPWRPVGWQIWRRARLLVMRQLDV
jgi:putative peptide zinc metalloprotease protein